MMKMMSKHLLCTYCVPGTKLPVSHELFHLIFMKVI